MQHKKRVKNKSLPLKKEDTLLMLQKYLGGEPFREIARSYQITPAAVAKRVRILLERVLDFNLVDLQVKRGQKQSVNSSIYRKYLFDTLAHKEQVLFFLESYLQGKPPGTQPALDSSQHSLSVKEFLVLQVTKQGINEELAADLIMFCSRELSKVCSPLSETLEKSMHQMDLLNVCQMAFILGKEVAHFQKKAAL